MIEEVYEIEERRRDEKRVKSGNVETWQGFVDASL
jgi:hypothetical protein